MFQKGQSGNPNGRPKGAKNKITEELRESLEDFVSENLHRLQDDFDTLTAKERCDVLIKLSEFVLPKLQRQTITNEQPPIQHTIKWNLIPNPERS